MTNLPAIAIPVGLFKSGKTGAGGQEQPMKRIRRDIFQRTKIKYGLEMTGLYKGLDPKSVIIDIAYDGHVEHDPHAARPLDFVTNDAVPGFWLGAFAAPNNKEEYSEEKEHTVRISTAPRQAPSTVIATTTVVPVEGEMKKVTTTTVTKKPVYGTGCDGKPIVTRYLDVIETSTMEVPAETEISYEGVSVKQVLGPRDFSPEAGGVTKEFTFEIYSTSESPFGDGGAPRND